MWVTLPVVATTGCSVYCIFLLMVPPEKKKVDGLGNMHVIRKYQDTYGQVYVLLLFHVCMLFMFRSMFVSIMTLLHLSVSCCVFLSTCCHLLIG